MVFAESNPDGDHAGAALAVAVHMQRAAALEALERWAAAAGELRAALALNPTHKQARAFWLFMSSGCQLVC